MRRERMQAALDRYARRADALPAGPERTVAMLGIMCVLAAASGRLVDMPEEWGWPRIPPVAE